MTGDTLGDGLFHFKVKDAAGNITEHSADVILLRLACEEAEDRHHLEKDEQGRLKPTAAFLANLAESLKQSASPEGCTPSIAYQLWTISGKLVENLKKNMSEPQNSPSGTDSIAPSSPEESEPGSTST